MGRAHKGERFHPDFAEALEVQRLLHAVVESSTKGGWIGVTEPECQCK